MHVIGFLDRYLIGVDKPEPHFEQEPVAELGFSFEIAVIVS
jgi:hypothetical protein